MDLRTPFLAAMPSPDWAEAAREGVLVACLACDGWRPWLPAAEPVLDAAERERVARKQRQIDRETTTFAYACHRLLLSAILGCEPADVPLFRDTKGCPRLRGDAFRTSLSHGDALVALAVCATGPVGVDIESSARAREMPAIAGHVAHPRELAALALIPERERNAALLALWVRKEALLKAAGIGLAREMNGFQAPADAPISLPGGSGTRVVLRMLNGREDSVAAIAGPADLHVTSAWLSAMGR